MYDVLFARKNILANVYRYIFQAIRFIKAQIAETTSKVTTGHL